MVKIYHNLKVVLIIVVLSLPFWFGINIFAKKEVNQNTQVFATQIDIEKNAENLKPLPVSEAESLEVGAKSATSVLLKNDGTSKILFEKDTEKKLAIASLTKLMTTLIALDNPDNYNLQGKLEISEDAVSQKEDFGQLKVGQEFFVKDLLYILLMESSNDTAYALAEVIGPKKFADLMNITGANLDLENTFYVNPTGLDPEDSSGLANYSTAEDLVKLTDYLLKKYPLVWEIISTPELDIYSSDGTFHHRAKNTNKLLTEIPRSGGKTGWTYQAQGCLVLIYDAPGNEGKIANVILGSGDHFGEMKKLVDWLNKSYQW